MKKSTVKKIKTKETTIEKNACIKAFTIEGFSKTNIYRMTAFYEAYENFPTAVGKLETLPIFNIPWGTMQ